MRSTSLPSRVEWIKVIVSKRYTFPVRCLYTLRIDLIKQVFRSDLTEKEELEAIELLEEVRQLKRDIKNNMVWAELFQ